MYMAEIKHTAPNPDKGAYMVCILYISYKNLTVFYSMMYYICLLKHKVVYLSYTWCSDIRQAVF